VADINEAIQYTLKFEDSTLSGKVTIDGGGRTRFGIAEKFHSELQNSLFFTSMGSEAALKIAESIYRSQYADPLCLEQIANQDIANKLLSLAVNVGVQRASLWLQDVVHVTGDGRIGPLTMMALGDAAPLQVLTDLREKAARFYVADAHHNPEHQQYLRGWLERARA
jgi:lysozyme family protein